MAQRSSASPDVAHLRSTAHSQLESTLFGRLPPEIREMVYAECWVVSGLRQHVFLDCHGRQLRHSPCILTSGAPDERNYEIQRLMDCRRRNRRGPRARSSVVVDRLWAARFSSDWHEHWPCEEMLSRTPEKAARNDQSSHTHRSLFLPILLLCKRTYIEALPSVYSSITFVFTDIKSALRCLSSPFHAPTPLLRSLIFSLALPFRTLHEQRDYYSPSLCAGPWARLCTTMSDMARFASLCSVTIRLDLDEDDGRGAGDWRRVRERWVLCAVRGMLARHLTVQLPHVVHLEQSRPYQYLDGDRAPFQIERYPKIRWVSSGDGRVVEPLVDPRPGRSVSPVSLVDSLDLVERRSKLRRATRGLRCFVLGEMSD